MPGVLTFEDRLSDVPGVERIWRSRSEHGGAFLSIAESRVEMAITRHQGRTFITLRGPETAATKADCPAGGDWLGIRFAHGSYMPALTPGEVREGLQSYLQATGYQRVLLLMALPGLDTHPALRSMRHFASDVAPVLTRDLQRA